MDPFSRPHHWRSIRENIIALVHEFLVITIMLGKGNVVGIGKMNTRARVLRRICQARYFLGSLSESGGGKVNAADSKLR